MSQKTNQKKQSHRSSKLLPLEIVHGGCYVDFEGFAGNEYQASPPPVLIGIYNQDGCGEFRQVVFTGAYRWAAEMSGVRHSVTYCDDRAGFLRELVSGSVRKASPLIAYSEYELNVIADQIEYPIKARYRNVRIIAERWLKDREEDYGQPGTWSLRDVASTLGVSLAPKLSKGGVTGRLRDICQHSSSKKNWLSAPAAIRKKWREVLLHNRSDVMGLHEILIHMQSE